MYHRTPDEVGLLVGGIMGFLPALAVLAFLLCWCSVIVERRRGTNRTTNSTPSLEARPVGVRPKIHEAMIDEDPVYYGGSHVLVWRKTQVSGITLLVLSFFWQLIDLMTPAPLRYSYGVYP